jgi:ABC-type transporter Mla subunit MlaD
MARVCSYLLLSSVCAVAVFGCGEQGESGQGNARVTATFATTPQLRVGAEVRAGGAVVGKVVELTEDSGSFKEAVMELDPAIYTDGQIMLGIEPLDGPPQDYVVISLPAPNELADPSREP